MQGNLLEEIHKEGAPDMKAKATDIQLQPLRDNLAGVFTPAPSSDSSEALQGPEHATTPVSKIEGNKNRNDLIVGSIPPNHEPDDCIILSQVPLKKKIKPFDFVAFETQQPNEQNITKIPENKVESKIGKLFNATVTLDCPCSAYFQDLSALFKTIPPDDERIEDLKSLLCIGFLNFRIPDIREYIVPNLPRDDPDLVVMYSTLAFCLLRGKSGVRSVLGS
ncbi:hypothetical protein AOL_s00110g193 [Orbilia oligospora ATCC 24927]|uniref:Uncharacterized protein n=1 Tax=Arthrobotrys oligospora (strain ATCC 24927 / CBS 115.81 / DSM 1491) TaxID=756982 RepID=G1XL23_ARTOA|nr:hypothetical protein AOL_s00110g193 [Orbilia oligospora ATCC 24927]EGX46029.1 hypothetical protein AOL_s00110g193 [Orbilia oligospora ATCC 24927]